MPPPDIRREGGRLDEFSLIERLLAPLAATRAGTFDLANDAAALAPPPGYDVVVTKDMMVAGVHFLPDDPPDLIARKLLRVNLSDLAAMGARPWTYALGLALPGDLDDDWLRGFVAGLAEDQVLYDIGLVGGDTVATPGPLVLSLTAMGLIAAGCSLTRGGAQAGDLICVTGTIGDGALGLKVLRGDYEDPSGTLIGRYRLPQPRCAFGQVLVGLATAALDVSDGLVADLTHLAKASGVGAVVRSDDVPLSPAAQAVLAADPAALITVLTGGDDYELVFTAPPDRLPAIHDAAARTDTQVHVIGTIVADQGVGVLGLDSLPLDMGRGGYRHR